MFVGGVLGLIGVSLVAYVAFRCIFPAQIKVTHS